MKILHLVEATSAGVGRHALDLAEGQAALGHDVTVLWSPIRSESAFVERLMSFPTVRAVELSMKRSPGPADASALMRLRAYVRAHGPFDVIHGQSSKGGALVRLLPRSLGGIRVYTPHAFRTQDPNLSSAGRQAFALMERVLGWRTDRLIAVSSHELEHAAAVPKVAWRKLALVPNGAELAPRGSRTEARALMGLQEGEVAVGFIGRLSPQKNPERFVTAIGLANRTCPALRAVIVGDGELRAACEAAAGDAPVRFMGWQDGPALIKGFDIFCMTSLYEGFPYTLLEAVHAGVPIVTTDTGGAREAVRNGETGLVLPVDASPQTVADTLVELAQDSDRRRSWGAANLAIAHEFTVERMVEQTLAVYESALVERARK